MNVQTDLTLILKHFHNGANLAYFSKYNPEDPTEVTWKNNGAGINEDSLICMADDLVMLDLDKAQVMTEEQMNMVSWVKWKDLYDQLDPTQISGSNVNCKRNLQTINTFVFWSGDKEVSLSNDFFDISATSIYEDNTWKAIVTTAKTVKRIKLEIEYEKIGINLHIFLLGILGNNNNYSKR